MSNEIRDSVAGSLLGETTSEFSETKVRQFHSEDLISISTTTSSKGNQPKWFTRNNKLFIKSQFEYQGVLWKDYMVEIIASRLSDIFDTEQVGVKVVKQNTCKIDDKYGVYSNNYSYGKQEEFVSFVRLASKTKLNLVKLQQMPIDGRFKVMLEVVKNCTGLDYTNYFVVMSLLDCLVGNEDRHLNNFGCLKSIEGEFAQCPLFDFGLGLFEHDTKYLGKDFKYCLYKMDFKPFSKKPQKVAEYLIAHYSDTLKLLLPREINIGEFQFPSHNAKLYFKYACGMFDIKVVY